MLIETRSVFCLTCLVVLFKININIVVLVFIFSFFRTGNYIFFRLFLMRISDIPYLDLAGDDGMSRKKNTTQLKFTSVYFNIF